MSLVNSKFTPLALLFALATNGYAQTAHWVYGVENGQQIQSTSSGSYYLSLATFKNKKLCQRFLSKNKKRSAVLNPYKIQNILALMQMDLLYKPSLMELRLLIIVMDQQYKKIWMSLKLLRVLMERAFNKVSQTHLNIILAIISIDFSQQKCYLIN